jgi:glutaredoxin 3
MSAPEIVVYSTAWCPYCARAKSLLEEKGAAFTEIDVDAVPGARAEMRHKSGRSTVPQIFIGPAHVGGCDDLLALEADGKLDPMLKMGVENDGK